MITFEDLEVIVTRHAAAPEPTEAAVSRHDAVCTGLMQESAVVPIRFGAVFSDDDRVSTEVAARAGDFRAALARINGCVELGVRVIRPQQAEETETEPATGSAYLQRRLEARRVAAAAAHAVDERLHVLAVDRTLRTLETPELVLSASYLVSRDGVDRFREAVEVLESERPDLTLLCTGPWPPYSFVADER